MTVTRGRTAPPKRRSTAARPATTPTPPTGIRRALLTLGALLLCLLALVAAMAGVFKVRHVDVVGPNLPVQQILRVANVQGHNVFRIRSDEVAARLGTVRSITVIQVETMFPDRVVIHARLRTPMVAWQRGPGLFVLDPQGNVIDQVAHTTLPVIVGTARGRSLGPGIVEAVRYAMTSWPKIPSAGVSSFRLDPKNGLSIWGRSGWQAAIGAGDAQTLVRRIAALSAFLSKEHARLPFLKYVDLRVGQPYARFVGG